MVRMRLSWQLPGLVHGLQGKQHLLEALEAGSRPAQPSGLPGGCFAPPRFQAPGAVSVARMLSCLLAALDCFLEAVPLAPLPAAVPACEPLPDLPGAANFWLSRVKHSCRDFL